MEIELVRCIFIVEKLKDVENVVIVIEKEVRW